MSTPQSNPACLVSVDRYTADVLREEAKKILEFNHDPFEDLRYFEPRSQYAFSLPFRDAFAVLDAIGWARDPQADQRARPIPMTNGLVDQLYRRRCDLNATNIDRTEDLQDAMSDEKIAAIRSAIFLDRLAIKAIDRAIEEYARTVDA
jgi:hypothetical protein